ncbi:beta-lactamase-like protein [Basidiobolus meristosporus CBS 931.73]|uniref:Beta-lactamase-like protein n=1 Tax=Basidiobolus meristosporus CBS 931.73 TaxID=1314790 RepID=A0A1Y1X4H0_9FUNG|nr:beta-lactamase-like protein [Basidiobolus meristosporus CBS 931.73]|eukprot:ORX80538.1 beta-lactamase-like protein [Basidiobolus meristosporus CBS 931.73]
MCVTCGTQFPSSSQKECPICLDERQYVPASGQKWTTLRGIQEVHQNKFEPFENDPRLTSIFSTPTFAIGQRGILIRTPKGNILWDCISLIDEETISKVKELGGLNAIAISHPHYYSSMVEWSKAFNDIPVYIHKLDEQWIMNPDKRLTLWEGDTLDILDGEATMVRCGGHFDGSCVLHWENKLFVGDTIKVLPDLNFVSFMWSYPNLVPLAPQAIGEIWKAVKPFQFDEMYGAWVSHNLLRNARAIVLKSAQRYVRAENHPNDAILSESL